MTKGSLRVRRLPGWFAYFELAAVLTAGGAWYFGPAWLPWTLPISLALTPWVTRLLLTGRLTRRTPFDLPLALFLLTALVSVWAAYDRPAAWQKFWLIAGGILLFYALVNGRSLWPKKGPAAADRRLWGLAALGAALGFYFMATHSWSDAPSALPAVDRLGLALQQFLPDLPGHRLNPNVAGGMLAFVVPFAGALVWTAGALDAPPRLRLFLQGAALAALALILLALFLSASRGAWAALAGALALFLLWRLAGWLGRRTLSARRRGSRRYRFRRQSALFGGALLALALPALLALLVWPAEIATLIERVWPASLADLNRLALWRGGLILASDYLFTGGGLNGFMMLYSTYSLLIHVGHSFHAHNVYLDVAVEQGLPALLLLGWCWLLVGRGTIAWLRPASGQKDRPVYAPALGAAFLSLATILLHGLVDDAFYGSRALLLFFVPLAFAVPRRSIREAAEAEEGPAKPALSRPQAARLLLVVLLAAGAFYWRAELLSTWYANLGAVAQSRAELSVYSWPAWDIQDRVRREVDLEPAIAHFQRALVWNPWRGTANRRLGAIALSRGEYEAALGHLEAAYQVAPWDNATRQWLGEAYLAHGRIEEGRALWSTVNNQNGQLAIRAYWYGQLDDPQRLAWIQEAVAAQR